jgi:hypothetical protein
MLHNARTSGSTGRTAEFKTTVGWQLADLGCATHELTQRGLFCRSVWWLLIPDLISDTDVVDASDFGGVRLPQPSLTNDYNALRATFGWLFALVL